MTGNTTTDGSIALYAGSANTWECDEMGHLNVRFYVRRAMEGLGLLALRLGMGGIFRTDARATLTPLDQHIRFLKEVRAGAPLTMVGGVLEWSVDGGVIYQELRHGDGTPAASFRTVVAHASPKSLMPFPWPKRMHADLEALKCALPAHGAARSIDLSVVPAIATLSRADSLGIQQVGAGIVAPEDCDGAGRMRPELVIGRVSDAVPNLLSGWRTAVGKAAAHADGQPLAAGAAVLEYRLAYRRWPKIGDGVVVGSGVIDVQAKTHRLGHWLLDPLSGEAWATCEAVAVVFDLKARKAIAPAAAQRKALEALIVPGLTI